MNFLMEGFVIECSAENISEWTNICRSSIQDAIGIIETYIGLRSQAEDKFKEALEPSLKCTKGISKILITCKPPVANPASCGKALANAQSTIVECKNAYALLTEALSLIDQADIFLGTVEPAFDEQGGTEAMMNLNRCGNGACSDAKNRVTQYVKSEKQSLQKFRSDIEAYRNDLNRAQEHIGSCKDEKEGCNDISLPEAPSKPVLEDIPTGLG